MTWEERIKHAQSMGWKVVTKEYYNPGGTTYRDVLVDPDGVEHGYVDKWVNSMSLGKPMQTLIPDENAEAWNDVPE